MSKYLNKPSFYLFVLLQALQASSYAQDSSATYSSRALSNTSASAVSKSMLFIGTQVPLQFSAGFGYQITREVSARVQAGIITKPFSGLIVDAMESFGMDKQLARVIRKSFQRGNVFGIGPQYHFGKNYLGIFGYYLHLKGGGITATDALSVYFKKDFSPLEVLAFPVFDVNMQSTIVNGGALFGHTFTLRNPRFSFNGEVSLSKVMASKNSFASNRSLIDRTSFVQNLYKEIDQEMQDAYWKYGFIPTVNFYFVYHL